MKKLILFFLLIPALVQAQTVVKIKNGGTQSTTRQAAFDTLSNVTPATTGWLLTDSSGHAVWQASAGGAAFLISGSTSSTATTAQWLPISGADVGNGRAAADQRTAYTIAKACTISLLTTAVDVAPGSSNGDSLKVYKSTNNGATWAATTASDATHTVSLAAGNMISIWQKQTSGSATAYQTWGIYVTIP